MSTSAPLEDTNRIPDTSTPEGRTAATDAPLPLTHSPEASGNNVSFAYVGDIDETPNVGETIERPNADNSNHVLLDLNKTTLIPDSAVVEDRVDSEPLKEIPSAFPESVVVEKIRVDQKGVGNRQADDGTKFVPADLSPNMEILAVDSNPIVAAKDVPNSSKSNVAKQDLNLQKASKASANSNLKTYKNSTVDSSPMRGGGHRESNLPRVATLYKTMKPTIEKSRMASRGEIPFIFRPNGSYVYITNYKDDHEPLGAATLVSKSNAASVPPRIAHLAVPKRIGIPNIISDANKRKPKQDIDNSTLDELLEGRTLAISESDVTKAEVNSSPNDVRQLDAEPRAYDEMIPKNLDTAAF
jgi:hypothetical protein